MLAFVAKRLGLSLVTILLVSIIVFLVSHILPGDVGRTILGPYASNEQVASLDHSLGLDRSLWVQYFDYITSFVRGDWGRSYLLACPLGCS